VTQINADPPASPEGEADGGQVCMDWAILCQLLLIFVQLAFSGQPLAKGILCHFEL